MKVLLLRIPTLSQQAHICSTAQRKAKSKIACTNHVWAFSGALSFLLLNMVHCCAPHVQKKLPPLLHTGATCFEHWLGNTAPQHNHHNPRLWGGGHDREPQRLWRDFKQPDHTHTSEIKVILQHSSLQNDIQPLSFFLFFFLAHKKNRSFNRQKMNFEDIHHDCVVIKG